MRITRLPERLRFVSRHPLATLSYLLANDKDGLAIARTEDQAAMLRRVTGRPSAMDDLQEYLGLPRRMIAVRMVQASRVMASMWRSQPPNCAEEFYQSCWEVLFEQARWHMDWLYLNRLEMLSGESGGASLAFGAGIGSEALVLAEQGNSVTYCDLPGSPVWRFAQWRASRHSLSLQFSPVIPEGMEFDCITAYGMVEIADDIAGLASQLCRVLKDGGRLYCSSHWDKDALTPMTRDRRGEQWKELTENLGLELRSERSTGRVYVKGASKAEPSGRSAPTILASKSMLA